MNNLTNAISSIATSMQQNMPLLLAIIGLLWAIHLINWLLGYRLNVLGNYPRSGHGLLGIFFSPFLHGDFNHLFFNSIPLFILSSMVLLEGQTRFFYVTLEIIIISGLAVWLLGRKAIHVGASGLIMGYWSYILFQAYQQRTVIAVLSAFIGIYYFGGLLFNLLPTSKGTSWESHVYGFAAGIAVHYISLPLIWS